MRDRDLPSLDSKVEWLAEALDSVFPDPVDEFEDSLAAQYGLFRHSHCPQVEWRRLRVRLLDICSLMTLCGDLSSPPSAQESMRR